MHAAVVAYDIYVVYIIDESETLRFINTHLPSHVLTR